MENEEAAIAVARRRLDLNPEDTTSLYYLGQVYSQEELLEFLRGGLSVRPIILQWHRAYQKLVEVAQPELNLQQEYEELLSAEPDNKTLMYLTGRLLLDSDAAMNYVDSMEGGVRNGGQTNEDLPFRSPHSEFPQE